MYNVFGAVVLLPCDPWVDCNLANDKHCKRRSLSLRKLHLLEQTLRFAKTATFTGIYRRANVYETNKRTIILNKLSQS